jgi:aldehyde dehydrogenase (NAD(P)+)
LPWGTFPGHALSDVQSGIGMVHNTRMFDAPQKSGLYGPFHPYPRSLLMGSPTLLGTPPWFVTHRRAVEVNRLLTTYEYDRNPASIRKLLLIAIAG